MRRFAMAILGGVLLLMGIAGAGAAAPTRGQHPKKKSSVRHSHRHRQHARKHAKHHAKPPAPVAPGEGGQSSTGPIAGPLPGPVSETTPVAPTPPAVEESHPAGGETPPADEAPPAEETPVKETPPAEEAKAAPSNPFAALPLYVEPGSPAARTAGEWSSEGRTAEAREVEKIAKQPVAEWFGDWSYGHGGTRGDVNWWVTQAATAGSLPVLVAYDLPWRDCSLFSSGGAANATAYETFIDEMAAGIGTRPAAVIVEPDALAELTCLGEEGQATYYSLLQYAVKTLGRHAATAVYLDAGHAGWQSPQTIASRLKLADVAGARGFSLNVSSFGTTEAEATYGRAIVAALGSASHFVIDTSRNGRGPAPEGTWCNPPGRGLGTAPTSRTSEAAIDAYLWVKHPGASDGTCNGGPAAGDWWPAQALELATNAAG